MTEKHPQVESVSTDRRLDPTLKAKWLEALRSGKYAQTQKALNDGQGFCCLGVLCDLMNPDGWDSGLWSQDWEAEEPQWCDGDLDSSTRLRVGLSSDSEVTLIRMNDEEKKNFTEIADWIEEHL